MELGDFEHWGVVVRPGETVKCDPGEIYCHISQIALHAGKGTGDVRVFVKVAGQEILLGTLSVDKYPQYTTDLVFEREFELLHTSKTSNISVIGYKFSGLEKRSDAYSEGDEAPLAIPLYSNADDDKRKEIKDGDMAAKPVAIATQSSKPKAALEETKKNGRLKADVGANDEDDSEQGECDDEEDWKMQNTEGLFGSHLGGTCLTQLARSTTGVCNRTPGDAACCRHISQGNNHAGPNCKRRGKDILWSNEKQKTPKTSINHCPGYGNLSKIGESSYSEISKQVTSEEVSRSVVSVASFIGDQLMYECTGMFIEGSCADVKSILTAASSVGITDLAFGDDLTIKVCLPNGQVITGWLHNSNLDYDLAVVNIKSACGFQTIDLSSSHHVQFDSNHKVVAVGRHFDTGVLKSSNGIVLSSPTNEDAEFNFSTCKIDESWIGGPLVDYEGNFVGMNYLPRGEKTEFIPKSKLLERLGPLRDNAADSTVDNAFTSWPRETCYIDHDNMRVYGENELKKMHCWFDAHNKLKQAMT